jgi:hypothetical protein
MILAVYFCPHLSNTFACHSMSTILVVSVNVCPILHIKGLGIRLLHDLLKIVEISDHFRQNILEFDRV